MAGDEWAQRWNAGRLVTAVETTLLGWHEDETQAAATLDRLLRVASPRAVVTLEREYRSRHRSLASMVDADALREDFGTHASAVAALLTLDRSGYLRETGVRWLAREDELFTLPFLLLRLNDPVDPVRELAAAAVRDRLDVGSAPALVQLLPLLDGLGRRHRAGPVARTVAALLTGDPVGRTALWRAVAGDDPAVRASCLRLLAAAEPAAAVEHAFAAGDQNLRLWAAAVATAPRLDPAQRQTLLPLLERDRNPRIRWRALRVRARQPDGEPYLRRALLDPDSRVRYLARTSLRTRGHTGSAALYRETLAGAADRDTLVGALAGLADLGTRDDSSAVATYLDHPTARVRGEAWRALAAIDPTTFTARLHQLRADPSAKVRGNLPRRQEGPGQPAAGPVPSLG